MTFPIIGDLAQSMNLRRQTSMVQIALAGAADEIATGRLADPAPTLASRMQDFAGIERRLTTIVPDLAVARETLVEAEAAQAALGRAGDTAQALSASLLGPAVLAGPSSLAMVARDATLALSSILDALNIQVGERSLFAGTAVRGPAVLGAEAMMDAVVADLTLAGAATPDDLIAGVDAFFAPGGGFETLGYLGATTSRAGLDLSASQGVEPPPRADDPDLRALLSATMKAALIDRDPLGLSDDQNATIAHSAGTELLAAMEGLYAMGARIGQTERRATLAVVELQTEEAALKMTRTELIGVDPYEAATRLADAEARLEKIFAITARLSRMTLTEWLR